MSAELTHDRAASACAAEDEVSGGNVPDEYAWLERAVGGPRCDEADVERSRAADARTLAAFGERVEEAERPAGGILALVRPGEDYRLVDGVRGGDAYWIAVADRGAVGGGPERAAHVRRADAAGERFAVGTASDRD